MERKARKKKPLPYAKILTERITRPSINPELIHTFTGCDYYRPFYFHGMTSIFPFKFGIVESPEPCCHHPNGPKVRGYDPWFCRIACMARRCPLGYVL